MLWWLCSNIPGLYVQADCGSDHELLIAKFRVKLNKVGKTTRPFKYDLNQIPNRETAPFSTSPPIRPQLRPRPRANALAG